MIIETKDWLAANAPGGWIDNLREKVAELNAALANSVNADWHNEQMQDMWQALGMLSSLNPYVEVNIEDPIGMARKTVDYVNAAREDYINTIENLRETNAMLNGKIDRLHDLIHELTRRRG
jgi:hypothetical protein